MTEPITAIFGPLNFEEDPSSSILHDNHQITCLLCEDTFNLNLAFDIFIRHLFETHSLVIEDVQNIHNLSEYLTYWKDKLKSTQLEEMVPSLTIDISTDKRYYLLSSLVKEDEDLRHKLRLEYVLKIQEFERTDTNYTRECLFCRTSFEGSRCDFLDHLSTKHNVYLGNPQNLVFIEELIDKIDLKLRNLNCMYCDKVFPERNVLKEHMRKKLHKRLNDKHSDYDKYFIVNYLECGKNWRNLQRENDRYSPNLDEELNNDNEYSDWEDKEDSITCLFCTKKETNINTLCLHMEADHEFDFSDSTKDCDFYWKVKLINYIRKKVHDNCCVYCDFRAENRQVLNDHLNESGHCKIPEDPSEFNQPEFYFPTYENDALLYLIDDIED